MTDVSARIERLPARNAADSRSLCLLICELSQSLLNGITYAFCLSTAVFENAVPLTPSHVQIDAAESQSIGVRFGPVDCGKTVTEVFGRFFVVF